MDSSTRLSPPHKPSARGPPVIVRLALGGGRGRQGGGTKEESLGEGRAAAKIDEARSRRRMGHAPHRLGGGNARGPQRCRNGPARDGEDGAKEGDQGNGGRHSPDMGHGNGAVADLP